MTRYESLDHQIAITCSSVLVASFVSINIYLTTPSVDCALNVRSNGFCFSRLDNGDNGQGQRGNHSRSGGWPLWIPQGSADVLHLNGGALYFCFVNEIELAVHVMYDGATSCQITHHVSIGWSLCL